MLNQPLDEFKPEAGQTVSVGNHKSELISAVKPLQYGEQSLAFPVEASGDVSDDLGVGVELSHVSDLPLEVSALLGRTDPAVADGLGVCLSSEEGVDVVEALSSCVAIEGNSALRSIAPQGLRVESEPLCGLAAGQVDHAFILRLCTTIVNECGTGISRSIPEGILHEVTIRKRNGRWYASIAYWKPPIASPQRETQSVGGVDVGISPLAVDSDYVNYENPKALDSALRKLRRWQRAKERRTLGSRGWWEAQRRLDAVQRRVTGLRNNAHHQVSRELVRKYHTLGIETLNVAGMIRAGLQSKALADAGMSGLLNQIRYKAQWYGTRIVEADQWYPSSRTCSACGVVNTELGREPRWSCPNCGVVHDRNENAARNLQKLALLAVGEYVTLPDGEALASDDSIAGETAPAEGRTKPMTTAQRQLQLAL